MAERFATLSPSLQDFLLEQKIFFIATAPNEGRVNLSPKGSDTLRVIDERRVAYLDLTGSAAETSAHLRQNGRMTLMVCSFDSRTMILRLYGRGRAVRPHDPEWAALIPHFQEMPGQRQLIVLDIELVQTSCGYAVPRYELLGERDTLKKWSASKGEDGLRQYRRQKNRISLDGLPTGLGEED